MFLEGAWRLRRTGRLTSSSGRTGPNTRPGADIMQEISTYQPLQCIRIIIKFRPTINCQSFLSRSLYKITHLH